MKESLLNGKSILAVNDELGVLRVIEEALRKGCPRCTFDKAATFYVKPPSCSLPIPMT